MFDLANSVSVDLSRWSSAVCDRFAGAFTSSTSGLWERLVAGELRIVSHATSGLHAVLRLRAVPVRERIELSLPKRHVLEVILSGTPQKCVGFELGLAPSSVSSLGSLALRDLGVNCPIGRAPLALATLVTANVLRQVMVTEWRLVPDLADHFEIRLTHPQHALPAILSCAERQVASFILEGLLHTEIARRRQRSARTVANQVHSVFCKLEVSGRFQLLRTVVARCAAPTSSLEALSGRTHAALAELGRRQRPDSFQLLPSRIDH